MRCVHPCRTLASAFCLEAEAIFCELRCERRTEPSAHLLSQIYSCVGQASAGSILREPKVTRVGNIGDDARVVTFRKRGGPATIDPKSFESAGDLHLARRPRS